MHFFSSSFSFPCNITRCRLGDFDIILVPEFLKIKYKLYVASRPPPPKKEILGAPVDLPVLMFK